MIRLRRPSTVRGRLVGLLLMAAIPVSLMAGFIAWQNYRIVAGAADEHVLQTQQAAVARYQTSIDEAARLLESLASNPSVRDGPPDECERFLRVALALQPGRFGNIAVLGTDGQIHCSARPVPPDAATLARVAAGPAETIDGPNGGFTVSGFGTGVVSGDLVLRVAVPIVRDKIRVGTLVSGMRIDWFNRPTSILNAGSSGDTWLVDGQNRPIAIAEARDGSLPAMPLAELPKDGEPVVAKSRNGELFDYASAGLLPELRLLVATPAGEDIARAERVLARRIAELSVMLLVGLALVAIGAKRAVVDPLKQLSQSVARWRSGGLFNPGSLGDAPLEIRELSQSFTQASDALTEREKQLRTAITKQDLLMQEIHHRVKNNLQIVASLLNLQASRIRLPEAKAEFQSARDRIRALATLHRHLYAPGELHTINMRSFLTELCGQLLQAIGEKPQGNSRISLHIEASELQISSDQAVPMALIVTEAVSNAAKYAFPAGRRGNIYVKLTTHGDHADLVIQDDGVGIPAGRAETETGIRDGLGIQLIRGFARQLGAKLTVTEDTGTCYHVHMKLQPRADEHEAAVVAVDATD